MLKPGDFFVGVIDFFSVLLPGALLTAILASIDEVRTFPLLAEIIGSSDAAQWVAFALASYALGHFLFLIAAKLDETVYDRHRKRKWPKETEHCYNEATELRQGFFGGAHLDKKDYPMNTFKWAKSLLMLRAPGALADVNRYEADSKFFRSMVVVLAILAVFAFYEGQWVAGLIALVLTRLSFSRYAERRHKSTEWAYQYVIVLDGMADAEGPISPEQPKPRRAPRQ